MLPKCIISEESQKLEHTADRGATPHGGLDPLLNKRQTQLPPAPVPKAAREKGTVILARSTANGMCATTTCNTKPAPGHQQDLCELAQVPVCVSLCSFQWELEARGTVLQFVSSGGSLGQSLIQV